MNSASAVVISISLRDVLLNEKAQQIGSLSEQISANDATIRDEVEGHLARMAKLNELGAVLREAYTGLTHEAEALQAAPAVTFAPDAPPPVNPLLLQPAAAPAAPQLTMPDMRGMMLMPSMVDRLKSEPISDTPIQGITQLPAEPKIDGKPISAMSNEEIARAAKNAQIEASQREPHVKSGVEVTFYDKGEPRPNGGSTRGEDEALMEEMRAESAVGLLTPTPASASNDAEVAPSPPDAA